MEYGHDIRSPDGRQVTRVLSVDYHRPIGAPERVTVVLWVNRVGRTSAVAGNTEALARGTGVGLAAGRGGRMDQRTACFIGVEQGLAGGKWRTIT